MTIKSVNPILKKFHDFPEGPKTCIATIQDVRFENVSYHLGDKAIFEGFTQTFKKGGKYAITGCSGSGKSTLLNIFLGNLKDYEGKNLVWTIGVKKRLMRTQSCLNVPMLGVKLISIMIP